MNVIYFNWKKNNSWMLTKNLFLCTITILFLRHEKSLQGSRCQKLMGHISQFPSVSLKLHILSTVSCNKRKISKWHIWKIDSWCVIGASQGNVKCWAILSLLWHGKHFKKFSLTFTVLSNASHEDKLPTFSLWSVRCGILFREDLKSKLGEGECRGYFSDIKQ